MALIRRVVKQLQANPNVTDEQRTALGIPVHKSGRSPSPAPASSPMAKVERIKELSHTLRLIDDATNRPSKPADADLAEVRIKVLPAGDPAPVAPDDLDHAGTASTTRLTRTFDAADAGKTAYYRFRWLNAKGEPGAWGPQVSATIAA